ARRSSKPWPAKRCAPFARTPPAAAPGLAPRRSTKARPWHRPEIDNRRPPADALGRQSEIQKIDDLVDHPLQRAHLSPVLQRQVAAAKCGGEQAVVSRLLERDRQVRRDAQCVQALAQHARGRLRLRLGFGTVLADGAPWSEQDQYVVVEGALGLPREEILRDRNVAQQRHAALVLEKLALVQSADHHRLIELRQ